MYQEDASVSSDLARFQTQTLQGRLEHGGLGDPVGHAAGLEEQVKMAAQQAEVLRRAVACCLGVIQPVIGQDSSQEA